MKTEFHTPEITVIGGGLAGVCAAIAAARMGRQVALIQNRTVLGGNSSSEVRVWVSSATAHGTQRYARETGIMGELFLENEYTNPEGNPYLWDLVLLEAVRREPNIRLFLNTDVHHLAMRDTQTIRSVTGWQMGAELEHTFESPLFLDCTGDGLVGWLAGAEYRVGREARAEYGEDWAPEVADRSVLGSTILFYTKDAGRPVPFVAPSFAIDITKTSIPEKRIIRSGDNGCHYWWIEWGGELDTIHDNERIRDELWAVVYGIWDYIKNSGRFPDSASMTLEWVGSIPGKRESRRFLGDFVLRQQDIVNQSEFDDAVAFGGWSIDLHPPQGVFSYESGSRHLFSDGVYQIPYRTLYSRNVANLLFAGRNISASHVAFGSTRVMATCATLGEAAGTAAALCLEHQVSPRGLSQEHRQTLVQTLLKHDASLIGARNLDPHDLAPQASVTASSHQAQVEVCGADRALALEQDLGILVPVDQAPSSVQVLLDVSSPTVLELEVWDTGKPQNYIPHRKIFAASVPLSPGASQWVEVPLRLEAIQHQNLFLVIKANPVLSIHLSETPLTGVKGFIHSTSLTSGDPNEGHNTQPLRRWNPKPLNRRSPCVRLPQPTDVYAPRQVVNGYARPYGGPNCWVSRPLRTGREEWLELRWSQPQTVGKLCLTFNDDVNEDLINLHHHRAPWRVIPDLVRAYRLEVCTPQGWKVLESVEDNRQRRRVHRLGGVQTSAVRVVVTATNGSPRAEIMEVRVYN
ncbi:MAG: FAD-dependent oxidoreductase [Meiothermus sp.]|nr:FAD-dependent oxidoreductase [Meiothermus sp.]